MDSDFALLLTGAGIALASSVITVLFQHYLSLRVDRIKRTREKEEERAQELREKLVTGIRGPTADLGGLRVLRQPVAGARDAWVDLKTRVQNRLVAELAPPVDVSQTGEEHRNVKELYDAVLAEEGIILSRTERQRLFEQIAAEILTLIFSAGAQEPE